MLICFILFHLVFISILWRRPRSTTFLITDVDPTALDSNFIWKSLWEYSCAVVLMWLYNWKWDSNLTTTQNSYSVTGMLLFQIIATALQKKLFYCKWIVYPGAILIPNTSTVLITLVMREAYEFLGSLCYCSARFSYLIMICSPCMEMFSLYVCTHIHKHERTCMYTHTHMLWSIYNRMNWNLAGTQKIHSDCFWE